MLSQDIHSDHLMHAMKLNFLKIFNSVATLIIAAGFGFLSFAFYIGSQEQYTQLIRELPLSFIFRFFSFSAVGMLGIGVLVSINFVMNRTVLKSAPKIRLQHVVRNGIVWILIACLVGNIIFFRLA